VSPSVVGRSPAVPPRKAVVPPAVAARPPGGPATTSTDEGHDGLAAPPSPLNTNITHDIPPAAPDSVPAKAPSSPMPRVPARRPKLADPITPPQSVSPPVDETTSPPSSDLLAAPAAHERRPSASSTPTSAAAIAAATSTYPTEVKFEEMDGRFKFIRELPLVPGWKNIPKIYPGTHYSFSWLSHY
jgi:hypothetical protein